MFNVSFQLREVVTPLTGRFLISNMMLNSADSTSKLKLHKLMRSKNVEKELFKVFIDESQQPWAACVLLGDPILLCFANLDRSSNSATSMYPKEMKSVSQRDICIPVLTAASLTGSKIRRQAKCLSMNGWILKSVAYVFI